MVVDHHRQGHLLDLSHLPEEGANEVVEAAYARVRAGHDARLWEPNGDPVTAWLEEAAAQRGLLALRSIYLALAEKLGLEDPHPRWREWEADRREVVLKADSLGLFARLRKVRGIEDVLALVDKVFALFAPEGAETQAAKDRVLRAYLAGGAPTDPPSRAARYPVNLSVAGRQFRLNADRLNEVRWMQAMGAEHVRGWSQDARSALKKLLVHSEQSRWPAAKLQAELFRKFGDLNRDWRRIAVTETNEAAVQGFVAARKPGARLRRVEVHGACDWCKSINGLVVTVVEPPDPMEEVDRDPPVIWPGKSNVGRSAAPNRRDGDLLVPRPASERYWIAAGVQHPGCRGSWMLA